jgi:phospholipase/carboxylesterase
MALDAVVSARWPVAGVVAFSGRLATTSDVQSHVSTRVLLVHGQEDMIIGVDEARDAHDRLNGYGISARLYELPTLGHSISSNGAATAGAFLADLLGPARD